MNQSSSALTPDPRSHHAIAQLRMLDATLVRLLEVRFLSPEATSRLRDAIWEGVDEITRLGAEVAALRAEPPTPPAFQPEAAAQQTNFDEVAAIPPPVRQAQPEARRFDPVRRAAHYNQGSIECITVLESALESEGYAAFLRGQVIKYMWRAPHKNAAAQDAEKAAYYLDRLVHLLNATPASPPASEEVAG